MVDLMRMVPLVIGRKGQYTKDNSNIIIGFPLSELLSVSSFFVYVNQAYKQS
jgi:hypothetical protein